LEGIEVHYPRYYYPPKVLRGRYDWFLWRSVRGMVNRLVNEKRPDAVLSYWAHPDGTVAVRIARQIGVPAVIMVGGSDVLLLTQNRARRQRILHTLHEADAVVTTSQDLRNKLLDFGLPPAKVHVVYRGVNTELFHPDDRQTARQRIGVTITGKMLLWVGRMEPVKGLDVLLEACSRLRRQDVDFHLYLVGEGSLRSALEADCRARGLEDVISFVGLRLHDQLPDWYRAADLTLLPSRSEGVPNVLRESLACGTPFVASRVGGIPEIADGAANRLVPAEDPAALAEAIGASLRERPTTPVAGCSTGSDEAAKALLNIMDSLVAEARRRPEPAMSTTRNAAYQAQYRPWRQWLRTALTTLLPRRLLLASGPATSKAVCLTFDDGPHPEYTPPLLDLLKKENVPATFFVVGQQAERYPDLVRRMVAEGHTVGHHTFTHAEPAQTSARQLLDETQRTRALLEALVGDAPMLFRPPKGKVTLAKLLRLWQARQTVVLWNVDPRDWASNSTDEVREWFRQRPLQGGDLVLLHETRPHAVEVLPDLVAAARKSGVRFTNVVEWLRPARD
jgi:peptidoglycan/xylan/chitin deacetylase (PgdA/CDA1 family)